METAVIAINSSESICPLVDNKVNGVKGTLLEKIRQPISLQDVKTVVKRALGTDAKLLDYSVKPFSEEKVGFLGAHRFLTVTIRRLGDISTTQKTEEHSFFLKTIPYEVEAQVSCIQSCDSFVKETTFYRRVVPELMKNSTDKSWCPRCYLAKPDLLVFENLKSRNFDIKGKILDSTSLLSALSTLAALHAASILAEDRLGKTFAELCPQLTKECVFTLDDKNKFRDWFNSSVDATIGVAENLGLESKNVAKVCHAIFEKVSPSKKWRNVVCHGDLWSYNMMFDAAKPRPNCALVDFQLARYTSAMVDVVQLLYLTLRRGTREKMETDLLRFYHDRMTDIFKENDAEAKFSTTFEERSREFEEMRLVGIVTASMYVPINSIEGQLLASLTQDSDGFMNLLFRERTDLVLRIMKEDSFYRDRITEIIEEMVQRSSDLLAL